MINRGEARVVESSNIVESIANFMHLYINIKPQNNLIILLLKFTIFTNVTLVYH